MKIVVFYFSISFILFSCKKDNTSSAPIPLEENKATCTTISYKNTIAPLFSTYCKSCHNSNYKAADVNLSDYESIKNEAEKSLLVIKDGSMPPSGKLSETMIQQIECWIKQGKLNN